MLSACVEQTSEAVTARNLWAETRRDFAVATDDKPFANGNVSVIAAEHGEMRTYLLARCGGGSQICAGGLRGHPGQLSQLEDYVVVSNAYSGRTFYLSAGGLGYLQTARGTVPLAWE
jgi:hypothetical protein